MTPPAAISVKPLAPEHNPNHDVPPSVVLKVTTYLPLKAVIDGVIPAVHAPPVGKDMVLAVEACWVTIQVTVAFAPDAGGLLIVSVVTFSVRVVVKTLPVVISRVTAPAEIEAAVAVSDQSRSLGCFSS
jgi:hypothetical protein